MFTSLSQFYNSQEWRKFKAGLIHDRVNPADGVLYDEFSGEPLLKSYDIVAHHKTPLTMQNVNDFSVSLNPENIMLVSQRSHNEIHSRFGFAAERKVYLVYGPPCSGKTTWVNAVKGNSDLVVDMDNIWQAITGGERYVKPNALKSVAFSVRDCLYDAVKTRTGKWERAYIITGGALTGERERLLTALGAEGVFVCESKETCLQRLATDTARTQQQKDEWKGYIERWFEDYHEE